MKIMKYLLNQYSAILGLYDDFYKDININNNIININEKALSALRFISLLDLKMNGYTIYVNNNQINEKDTETQSRRYEIYFQELKDTTPQTVYFSNNNLGTFTDNHYSYNCSTDYNIIKNN